MSDLKVKPNMNPQMYEVIITEVNESPDMLGRDVYKQIVEDMERRDLIAAISAAINKKPRKSRSGKVEKKS